MKWIRVALYVVLSLIGSLIVYAGCVVFALGRFINRSSAAINRRLDVLDERLRLSSARAQARHQRTIERKLSKKASSAYKSVFDEINRLSDHDVLVRAKFGSKLERRVAMDIASSRTIKAQL